MPQTLNAAPTTSQAPAPRRRRAGDSPKESESGVLQLDKRVVGDPFAQFDSGKLNAKLANGIGVSSSIGMTPGQKPLTYEQKLKNEASKGSFLDMISNNGS